MSIAVGNNFNSDDASHLAQIIDQLNAGIWEYNVNTKDVKWSAGFYTILGYVPGEIPCSYNFFLEDLLYHHDRPVFLKAIHTRTPNQTNTVQIRLLTKSAGYQWFESVTKKWEANGVAMFTGSLVNINKSKILS